VTDLASGKMTEMTGEALMKSGVRVTIDTQPGVAVTVYNKK
jgi:hypothetical protein